MQIQSLGDKMTTLLQISTKFNKEGMEVRL